MTEPAYKEFNKPSGNVSSRTMPPPLAEIVTCCVFDHGEISLDRFVFARKYHVPFARDPVENVKVPVVISVEVTVCVI